MIPKQKNVNDLVGKVLTVKTARHGFKKGARVKVHMVSLGHPDYFYVENNNSYYFTSKELEDVALTKKDFENKIKELEKEIAENKKAIDIMNSLGLEEYDEEYIRVYAALEILETSKSKAAKAKVLVQLIKKGS